MGTNHRIQISGLPSSVNLDSFEFSPVNEGTVSFPVAIDLATTQIQVVFRNMFQELSPVSNFADGQFLPTIVYIPEGATSFSSLSFGSTAINKFRAGRGGSILRWPKRFRGANP